MKRRFALVGSVIALFGAIAALAAVILVDRALASTLEHPEVLCLTQKDREKIAGDTFPEDRRDYFVSKAINFKLGVPRMLWWHLRGATIHLTYVTFWSPTKRREVFNSLTSKMRGCPPSLQR